MKLLFLTIGLIFSGASANASQGQCYVKVQYITQNTHEAEVLLESSIKGDTEAECRNNAQIVTDRTHTPNGGLDERNRFTQYTWITTGQLNPSGN